MSGEFEKPVVPDEKYPGQPKWPELTPAEIEERDALFEQITTIVTAPAIDDPNDEVLFDRVMKPLIKLGKTEAFRRHYRGLIVTDFWKTFVDKTYDRTEGDALSSRIDAYNTELWEQRQAEMQATKGQVNGPRSV